MEEVEVVEAAVVVEVVVLEVWCDSGMGDNHKSISFGTSFFVEDLESTEAESQNLKYFMPQKVWCG